MCFWRSSKDSEASLPARVAVLADASTGEKSEIPSAVVNNDSAALKPKDDEYGESMGLSMHAKHQKMIRDAYPDGNVPEELERFRETGMAQGPIGGPVGGGVGMAMSGGF